MFEVDAFFRGRVVVVDSSTVLEVVLHRDKVTRLHYQQHHLHMYTHVNDNIILMHNTHGQD